MFEIKGFAFIPITDEQIEKIPINGGFFVDNWDEAHELMKKHGVEHYLITLKKVA
jgi:hypothetical protein